MRLGEDNFPLEHHLHALVLHICFGRELRDPKGPRRQPALRIFREGYIGEIVSHTMTGRGRNVCTTHMSVESLAAQSHPRGWDLIASATTVRAYTSVGVAWSTSGKESG